MARTGRSPKTTLNALGILHSIFELRAPRGLGRRQPVHARRQAAASDSSDPDIRFLDHEELEALLRAVPDDDLGRVERRMYLTAAMTGMRQGELLALRWRDVDLSVRRVRVRRNYMRGEFGVPKSRALHARPASRCVPPSSKPSHERSNGRPTTISSSPIRNAAGRSNVELSCASSRTASAGWMTLRFHDLRHTFGTRMAAAGVPMRTLQEWMGHPDYKTTLIYADYAPSAREAEWVEAAFGGERTLHPTSNQFRLTPVVAGSREPCQAPKASIPLTGPPSSGVGSPPCAAT